MNDTDQQILADRKKELRKNLREILRKSTPDKIFQGDDGRLKVIFNDEEVLNSLEDLIDKVVMAEKEKSYNEGAQKILTQEITLAPKAFEKIRQKLERQLNKFYEDAQKYSRHALFDEYEDKIIQLIKTDLIGEDLKADRSKDLMTRATLDGINNFKIELRQKLGK